MLAFASLQSCALAPSNATCANVGPFNLSLVIVCWQANPERVQAEFEARLASARDEATAGRAELAAEWQAKLDATAAEHAAALEEAERGVQARVAEAAAEWRKRLDAAHQEWAAERARMEAEARAAASTAEAAAQRRLKVCAPADRMVRVASTLHAIMLCQCCDWRL